MGRRSRFRALVLSAGFGSRLRPLTLAVPKPLLAVPGSAAPEPVTGATLRRLFDAGCEAAVLNLHHLADAVSTTFGRSWHGLPLSYTHEETIQGTLGALHPPREILKSADAVVVVNGDTMCRWPFEALLGRHHKTGAAITLLLLRQAPDAALGGGIGVDGAGRVVQLRDLPAVGAVRERRIFAGVTVLSPRVLDRVEPGFGDVVEGLWQPLLQEGERIESLSTRRPWHDLGTPTRYLEGVLSILDRRRPRWWPGHRRPVISPLASCADDSAISRSLVEREVSVGSQARVEASVLLEGAWIGSGCRIARSIVGPGVRLPPGTDIEGRMICRADRRHELGDGESQLGDLIYTPL